MRKRHHRNQDDEINFWQPASDMFSALLLILMLVILLMGLYLVQIPEHREKDPNAGDTYADGGDEEHDNTETPMPTAFIWIPGGGGGGGWGGGGTPQPTYYDLGSSPSVSPSPTISPTPDLPGAGAAGGGGGTGGGEGLGEGPGEEPDMGMKSAVYVMMVDAETERTIKEPNVQFELYGENHSLQILNTYYPQRISFRYYETTEGGVFYLPEKLQLGSYELHELTEPEGYDASENIEFIIAETYDWSDPYVVQVPIYPSRNVIQLRMMDAETGRPLAGGTFDVIAAENIITSDGTLRYRMNQIVSEIVCDETGTGESEELYLGQYLVRQRDIPQYYIGQEADLEATVEKKTGRQAPVYSVSTSRSKIRVSLKDELYPARGIAGATFSVSAPGSGEEPVEVRTDSSGNILLDALEKGVTYQIRQTGSEEHYRLDNNLYTVQVSPDGRINGEQETSIELFNHMIRVSIGITDEFSNIQVADVNLALFDSGGTLVRTWTSTGAPLIFTDLEPGAYYIVKDGDTSTRYDIRVQDEVEVQSINLQTSYMIRYMIFGGIALFALLVLIVAAVLIIRRRRKKKKQA